LSDRLADIQARLEQGGEFTADDVAYLLAEVERLAKRVRMYEVVKS
jgi:hypothetical protein